MLIVCEPQCYGFEHVNINAALIAVLRNAYPDRRIVFFAEKHHLHDVEKILNVHSINNVTLCEMAIPERTATGFVRFIKELSLCKKVFKFAHDNGCNRLLFGSITREGLYSVKAFLIIFRAIRCYIVPHSILETILAQPPLRPWRSFFWWNCSRLTYIVLGESICKQLISTFPAVKDYVNFIDHPYFYKYMDAIRRPKSDTIIFGAFGVASRQKGSQMLFSMAEEINKTATILRPQFILIGSILDKALKEIPAHCVSIPSPETPLTAEQFDYYASSIDYSIFTHTMDLYRLTASGALFDAFSYIKPIIAIRNPFFEHYFSVMGDIGYLCDDYDEMLSVISEILNHFPSDRYILQCNNILLGREKINIPRLAEKFAMIWENNQSCA
jgi:hypothetical protein